MESALRALIRGVVPGVACDWGMNAAGAGVARVVLQTVSGGQNHTFDGPDTLRGFRVQVDCYGATYLQAKTIARQIVAGIGGHRAGVFQGIFLDSERDIQPDTGAGEVLFRVSLDFMVHHKGV